MTELSEEMFSNPYYCLFEIPRSQSLYFFGYLGGLGLLFPCQSIGRIIMRGLQEFDDDQE